MEVPTATSLRQIYPSDQLLTQGERWNLLLSRFEAQYGHRAQFVARSPGRVNIIGEHIDYSLYQVLPMAVLGDVLMAVSVIPRNGEFKIANVQFERFPSRGFRLVDSGSIEGAKDWSNYFKAALQGASQCLREEGSKDALAGMQVLVDGNVTPGGGLSSSSAFSCAATLAVLHANKQDRIDKTQLCELAITSERKVGVNSGGMDQASSIFAVEGSALFVSFVPKLEVEVINIPKSDPSFVFLVAQSLVEADKHASGPECYNLRVVEVTLAAHVLAKVFKLNRSLPKDTSPLGTSLRGFHDTYFEENEDIKDNKQSSIHDFAQQLDRLVAMVEQGLPQEEGYTREQISQILGISVGELHGQYMTKVPVRAERFKLRQRALHVFTEASRAIRFRRLLLEPPGGQATLLHQLGSIMNQTQDSCRDVYECSCPELDELCTLARQGGAAGSRLTGAGWGGATVHLVPEDEAENVVKTLTAHYYRKRWPDMDEAKLKEAIIMSRPGSGTFLFNVADEIVE